jgi:hypothetical protein
MGNSTTFKGNASRTLCCGQGVDFQGENILMLAKSEYHDMLNDNTWTGIHTKGTESVFQAGGKNSKGHQGNGEGPECWNGCGGRHMVQDCKKPLDQKRISANKKKFYAALEKKRNSNGGKGQKVVAMEVAVMEDERITVSSGKYPRVVRTIRE